MENYIIIIYFVLFSSIGSLNYYISRKYADKKSHTIAGSAKHMLLLMKMYWIIVVIEIFLLSTVLVAI